MPSCLVLLCTYNGEKYLREQLDSILNQKGVDIFIKIADDRSNDDTVNILKEYANKYSNVEFSINEKNKKFTYNFIDLLFSINSTNYDYYAFADQDDVWLDNKVISAIATLKNSKNENGMLYCSNLTIVDKDLNKIGYMEDEKVLKTNKYNILASNIATGCTIVFNNAFMRQVTKYYPVGIYLHDYWLLLVATFTAEYFYDINSYILYRQHGNNQIGGNKKTSIIKKINNFIHKKNTYFTYLLKELLNGYSSDIQPEDCELIKILANYRTSFKNKLKIIFSRKIKRLRGNLMFKIKILTNRF